MFWGGRPNTYWAILYLKGCKHWSLLIKLSWNFFRDSFLWLSFRQFIIREFPLEFSDSLVYLDLIVRSFSLFFFQSSSVISFFNKVPRTFWCSMLRKERRPLLVFLYRSFLAIFSNYSNEKDWVLRLLWECS